MRTRSDVPAPDEIYLAYAGGDERRPVIIVSREELNRGDYVVVVPLTTERLEERWRLPNCVPLQGSKPGIQKDCVAQAEAIAQLHKEYLDVGQGPLGEIDTTTLRELIKAIGNVISADCEPT